MRKITLIIVHCSANKAGSKLRMADIDRYHRTLGWTGCGYHYVIPIDGTIEPARPEDITGAHCRSHNSHSIGICYINGLQPTAAPLRTHARKPRRVPFVICWSPFTEAIESIDCRSQRLRSQEAQLSRLRRGVGVPRPPAPI